MDNNSKQIKATILNVIPDERLGGPQQRVLQVAKRLKQRGFNSIVVLPEGDRTFANMLDDADVPHYQVRSFRKLPHPSNPLSIIRWLFCFIPCVVSLMRLIRNNKVDIVHVNGIMNVQVSFAAKLSRAKLVWHLNDVRNVRLLKAMVLPLIRLLSDRVVAASEAAHRNYFGDSKNGTDNAAVLYPPVDTATFHPDYYVERIRNELRLNEKDKIVGTVGNINPAKGYEYFFSAAKLAKEAFPQIRILVVGKRLETQEKYWQRLHTQIVDLQMEDDIILTGYRADIPEMINTMDVFVLASAFEAAPIAVLEAMACAKPVVATRVGGVAELVADGETGILVPPRDPQAIADAVLHLLNHPEEAREMGARGRQRMIDHFDLAICVQRHEEIYKMVLQS